MTPCYVFIIDGEKVSTQTKVVNKDLTEKYPDMKEIEIPEGITSIASLAFMDCSKLKRVKLPSTIKNIDANAFVGCTALEQVVVPNEISEIMCWGDRRVWSIDLLKPYKDLVEMLLKGYQTEFRRPSDESRWSDWD